jgi:hypothetical protein
MVNIEKTKESNRILEEIKADRFTLRDHAIRRSDERLLTRQDVMSIAETVLEGVYQEEKFTHRFIGFLAEGRPGGFTAVLDDEGLVRVVTVFKRRLSESEKRRKS